MKASDGTLTTLYAVHTTEDEYGRRGETVGYFRDEEGAHTAAVGKGWYGGRGSVERVTALTLDHGRAFILARPDSVAIDVDLIAKAEDARKSARAKLRAALSGEEIEALGIDLKD